MRLLLKLVPKKSHPYVNDYHYHLQAAIYSLIREGGLPDVHEKKGYKFFCFSNIFPYGDFKKGVERSLLISSPNYAIIESIERASRSRISSNGGIFVGELQFEISDVSRPFRINLEGNEAVARSATPMVMRIPRARYLEYGIDSHIDYDYVFWRETISLDAFVKQLRDNIAKKANEYFRELVANPTMNAMSRIERESLPEIVYYKFIRTVSKPITIGRQKHLIIGSIWEIKFTITNYDERKTLEFAMDCGLGERNSLGFGFINVH